MQHLHNISSEYSESLPPNFFSINFTRTKGYKSNTRRTHLSFLAVRHSIQLNMSSKNQPETNSNPGPVPLPPPNRRASFSQNPSFQTLFGSQRGSPPKAAPDPSLSRRFSWSFAPPKETTSAIDDSDDLATSPTDQGPRRGSEIGRRLSTTASSLREALGLKFDEPPSPGTARTVSPCFYRC